MNDLPPMRIWLSPSAYWPSVGGVEEVTRRLALGLQQRGHEVLVVTHRWPSDTSEDDVLEGVTVKRMDFVQVGRRPSSWPRWLEGRREVRRGLAKLPPPDLVHVHCVAGQAAHMLDYCRSRMVPLVVTTHGETAMDEHQIYRRSVLHRRAFRAVADGADALTACSEWTRRDAAALAPAYGQAQVVRNGVDVDHWRTDGTVEDPVFAAYGRHVAQKGFAQLLAAFEEVRTALPQARLLLGGDGTHRRDLEQAAGPGVTFLGRLDRQGVRSLLHRSRVVVVPSLVEPFGLVALEALAAARRLVFSDVGGLGELGRGRGWAARPGDVPSLAKALLSAHRDPPRHVDIDAFGRDFSWEAVLRDYERVYERASSRSAGGPPT